MSIWNLKVTYKCLNTWHNKRTIQIPHLSYFHRKLTFLAIPDWGSFVFKTDLNCDPVSTASYTEKRKLMPVSLSPYSNTYTPPKSVMMGQCKVAGWAPYHASSLCAADAMGLAAPAVGGTSTLLTGSAGPRATCITWPALPAFLARGNCPLERSSLHFG